MRRALAWRPPDRGRIAVGLRADLILIDGDPTTGITHTLSIRTIWRRGEPSPAPPRRRTRHYMPSAVHAPKGSSPPAVACWLT
ncbi:hypothetical protein AB0J72_12830 [Dactylosporangium sp. NPDC049742]|uniref:hypothetical protein n=1 Tax=Dactylosporangium sp. NPDC049742 TaxID=3154737 RepID=UPI00341A27BE